VHSALGGGEFGPDQVLIDFDQLGLICVDVVENNAADRCPVELLRCLKPVNTRDRVPPVPMRSETTVSGNLEYK
jgi:hypothetical protein